MTSDERRSHLRWAILSACRDSLVRESVLQSQLAHEVQPAPMLSEIQTEMKALESQGFVTGLNPSLGGPAKWVATDLGRAALQG